MQINEGMEALLIRDILEQILEGYPTIADRASIDEPGKTWFRIDARNAVRAALGSPPQYVFKASPGMTNAADVPWIGIRRSELAPSFRQGIYVVYLFAADHSAVFLSLNQGVTNISGDSEDVSHAKVREFPILKEKAGAIRELLTIPERFRLWEIDLAPNKATSRAYEMGHICGVRYDREELPTEAVLLADLNAMLRVYDTITPEGQFVALADDEADVEKAPPAARKYVIGEEPPLPNTRFKPIDSVAWSIALQRRKDAHRLLLDAVARAALKQSLSFDQTTCIDLVVDSRFIVEAKSLNGDAIRQARNALSQLYHYKFLYREEYPNSVLIATFDSKDGLGTDLIGFLEECRIHVFYLDDGSFKASADSQSAVPWLR